MAAYNGSKQVQQQFDEGLTRINLQKQQTAEAKAGTAQKYADANLADSQSRALIGSQQPDPFGNTSTLPQKELLKQQDSFQTQTVN